MGQVAKWNS